MPTTPSATAGTALPLAWWSPGGGFSGAPALVSLPLPSPPSTNGASPGRICLVGLRDTGEREAARLGIRQAVCAALAGLLGIDPAAIELPAAPGDAPYALLRDTSPNAGAGQPAARRVALAISHDEALSVAAIGLDEAVGIDVMRVADIPDWEALARDYLGPDAAHTLAGLAPAHRPLALARAWSEREARLKCLGLTLTEWRPDEPAALAACTCLPLAVPEGYVGTLAMAPAASD
jgi:4'-phosphopantetheinyl transferase